MYREPYYSNENDFILSIILYKELIECLLEKELKAIVRKKNHYKKIKRRQRMDTL